jgi:hypothetical protein
VTRRDLIANEMHQAATYRREAKSRARNPALAAMLTGWAEASERRAEAMRSGPLFYEVER